MNKIEQIEKIMNDVKSSDFGSMTRVEGMKLLIIHRVLNVNSYHILDYVYSVFDRIDNMLADLHSKNGTTTK